MKKKRARARARACCLASQSLFSSVPVNPDHVDDEGPAADSLRLGLQFRDLSPPPAGLERQTGMYREIRWLIPPSVLPHIVPGSIVIRSLSPDPFFPRSLIATSCLQSHPAYNVTFPLYSPSNTTTILVPIKPCPWICELTNDTGYVIYR